MPRETRSSARGQGLRGLGRRMRPGHQRRAEALPLFNALRVTSRKRKEHLDRISARLHLRPDWTPRQTYPDTIPLLSAPKAPHKQHFPCAQHKEAPASACFGLAGAWFLPRTLSLIFGAKSINAASCWPSCALPTREAPQSFDCGASLGSGALLFALACAVWCYEHRCECDEVECSYDACD